MKSLLSRGLSLTVKCLSLPLSMAAERRVRSWLVGSMLMGSCVVMQAQAAGMAGQPEVQLFIDELVREQGFDQKELETLFKQVVSQDRVIELMDRPAERSLEWWEYRNRFISDLVVRRGVEFWKQNRKTLEEAEKTYGVPAYVILGILGVETHYGRFRGGYRVVDALSTLGFNYPRRATYFQRQLKAFLMLSREQGFDPLSLTGSYAGAMGIPQFMPSSYREYAIDFDGSGQADIWDSPADAVGSIASYLSRHGWTKGKPVATQARVKGKQYSDILKDDPKPSMPLSRARSAGWTASNTLPLSAQVRGLKLQGADAPEYWLTLENFYVITRYNRSNLYAMAVYQLGKEVQSQYQVSLQEKKQSDTLQAKADTSP